MIITVNSIVWIKRERGRPAKNFFFEVCSFTVFIKKFFSDFNFTTVVCITAMINYKLIAFSAVQLYDISYQFICKD